MTSYYKDNIIAIATAPQNGAIGIIRLSGTNVKDIFLQIFRTAEGRFLRDVKKRYLYYGMIVSSVACVGDGQGEGNCIILDHVMAVYMPGPNSFTGEDIVELHCHGNLILLKMIVAEILKLNREYEIRDAEPGEFSKRAYLNQKIDLAQAESIHELISAESQLAIKSSLSNLDGKLSALIENLKNNIKISLALVEASFEFPEEDIQTYDHLKVMQLLSDTKQKLELLKSAHQTSKIYDHGIKVVIVGEPNVGKSSLLNAILVEERSIVTPIAGTTRDVVYGTKIINGIKFIFLDTAGLRQTEHEIENIGIEKSKEQIQKADILVHLADNFESLHKQVPGVDENNQTIIKVLNKADILFPNQNSDNSVNETHIINYQRDYPNHTVISAKCDFGIQILEQKVSNCLNVQNNVQNNHHINERQIVNINNCLDIIVRINKLDRHSNLQTEILAEEMRSIILELDKITGTITNDDILGEIFKRFCIGK